MSIFVFCILMIGFFWIKHKSVFSKINVLKNQPQEEEHKEEEHKEEEHKCVYPDGTIETHTDVPFPSTTYIFTDGSYVKTENNIDYLYKEGKHFSIDPVVFPLFTSEGVQLNEIGFYNNTFYEYDDSVQKKIEDALFEEKIEDVQKIFSMMKNKHLSWNLIQSYIKLKAHQKEISLLFLKQNCQFNELPEMYKENLLLEMLKIHPMILNRMSLDLQFLMSPKNHYWKTNKILASALKYKRYDIICLCLQQITDIRTFSERTCFYTYHGDEKALLFYKKASNSTKALSFYIAVQQQQKELASSILLTFNKDEQKKLYKMFTKFDNNTELLKIFKK